MTFLTMNIKTKHNYTQEKAAIRLPGPKCGLGSEPDLTRRFLQVKAATQCSHKHYLPSLEDTGYRTSPPWTKLHQMFHLPGFGGLFSPTCCQV